MFKCRSKNVKNIYFRTSYFVHINPPKACGCFCFCFVLYTGRSRNPYFRTSSTSTLPTSGCFVLYKSTPLCPDRSLLQTRGLFINNCVATKYWAMLSTMQPSFFGTVSAKTTRRWIVSAGKFKHIPIVMIFVKFSLGLR